VVHSELHPVRVLLCFIFAGITGISVVGQSHFGQFRADGLSDESDCRHLEDVLRLATGLEYIRAEAKSGNVLLFSSDPLLFDVADLTAWLTGSGVAVRCYREGVLGTDPILRLAQDCDAPPGQPQRE